MINVERLEQTFAFMREHLEQWNQLFFIEKNDDCSTTMCLAGFGVTLFGPEDGFTIVFPDADDPRGFPYVIGEPTGTGTFFYSAKAIFGMTFDEAHECFIDTVGITDIDELEEEVYRALDLPLARLTAR